MCVDIEDNDDWKKKVGTGFKMFNYDDYDQQQKNDSIIWTDLSLRKKMNDTNLTEWCIIIYLLQDWNFILNMSFLLNLICCGLKSFFSLCNKIFCSECQMSVNWPSNQIVHIYRKDIQGHFILALNFLVCSQIFILFQFRKIFKFYFSSFRFSNGHKWKWNKNEKKTWWWLSKKQCELFSNFHILYILYSLLSIISQSTWHLSLS